MWQEIYPVWAGGAGAMSTGVWHVACIRAQNCMVQATAPSMARETRGGPLMVETAQYQPCNESMDQLWRTFRPSPPMRSLSRDGL